MNPETTYILDNPCQNVTVLGEDLMILDNPMRKRGDMIAGGLIGTPVRVENNTTTTRKFLMEEGTGTDGATPTWEVPAAGEISNTPAGTISSTDVQSAINELDVDVTAISDAISEMDTSTLVPYTGATGEVDLGAEDLTTTGTITAGVFTGVVPYTGASDDVDLGENKLTADNVTITGTVTDSTDAATKQYVDDAISGIVVINGTDGADGVDGVNGTGTVGGTGTDDQIAVWTGTNNIEGTTGLTFDGTDLVVEGNIRATGEVSAFDNGAPIDWWDSMPTATDEHVGGVTLYDDSDTTHFLRGDGTWQVGVAGDGDMVYPAGSGIPTVVGGAAWGSTVTDNSTDWDEAYGWGDHADAGYAPTAEPVFTTSFGFDASKWRIVEDGDHLSLQYNGSPKGILEDDGTMSFTGDVIAFATLEEE
jgi:hypothetical protein